MNKDEIISEARLRQIHTLESAIEKRNMRIRSLEKTLGKTSIELLDDNERLSMQRLFYEMDWHIAMAKVAELEAREPILCANCNDHYERGEKWYCEMCHEPIMESARQLDARVNELEIENAELKRVEEDRWHKYPDEKPLIPKQDYLTYNSKGEYYISFWLGGSHWDNSDIIYWRELPAPPEEEK